MGPGWWQSARLTLPHPPTCPTTPSHSTPCSFYSKPAKNWYSDAELVAAGGDADGTLDFYQVHSYPDWGDAADEFNSNIMPFFQPKSFWRLDKPLLVGEFWDAVGGKGEGSLTADAWAKLFQDGYEGRGGVERGRREWWWGR